jgi:hypothetical protein
MGVESKDCSLSQDVALVITTIERLTVELPRVQRPKLRRHAAESGLPNPTNNTEEYLWGLLGNKRENGQMFYRAGRAGQA